MSDIARVMYADDSDDASEAVAALERATDRLVVERATRPNEVLAGLSDNIDCLVAAYEFPTQDSIPLLTRIRETYPDLPFVLVTGNGDERVASEAITAGVSEYLPKDGDFEYATLANRIETLLDTNYLESDSESDSETDFETDPESDPETDSESDPEQRTGKRFQQRLLAITADSGSTLEEKMSRLLELGCERFGTANGHLVKIDRDSGRHEVVSVFGSDIVTEGVSDLSTTYCRRTIESTDVLDVHDAVSDSWEDDPAYLHYGFDSYIGQKLLIGDELYGTLCFVSEESRATAFNHEEKAFMRVLSQWFSQLLVKRRYRTQAETIFEHSQDAIFLSDITRSGEFRIRRVNDLYEEMIGRSMTELRGKTPTEIVGEEKGAILEAHYQRCVDRQEPVKYQEQLEVGTDSRHWQTKLAPVIEDGEVIQLVGTTRDITEQKAREHKIRVRNQAMETASAGITISDPTQEDNPLIYVNEYFEQLTGYDKEEIIGRNCRFLQGEETAPETVDEIREAISARESVSVELRNYRKDGTEFWNRLDIAPVFDDNDELIHFVGYQQDITDNIEYERQLERQNERLERFASVLSHDLRNPLNVAQGRLEIAMDDCDSEHLEIVADSHDRIENLIEDLLTLTDEGKRSIDSETIDFGSLAEQSWKHVETNEVTLGVSVERSIEADRDKLTQLLENLIRNAVEHGGELSTITMGTFEHGFYVEDDGEGIPAAKRDQIFEDGYTTSREGTGLGLTIVSELVDSHDWTLAVTEGPDGGARFEIRTGDEDS